MKNKVVLDSSLLLSIEENKVDIFQEIIYSIGKCEFYIPLVVMNEIENLAKNKGKRGVKAKTALLLIKKYEENIEVIPSGKIPDKAVVNLALDLGGIVATSDKKMKEISLRRGLRVIRFKGKKLEML